MVFAILSDPFWRRIYVKLEKQQERNGGGEHQPEWRLPPGMYTETLCRHALLRC
jgi:hypothetical protein